jgi:endonuclease III
MPGVSDEYCLVSKINVMPVDMHSHRIAMRLGMTGKWSAVEASGPLMEGID